METTTALTYFVTQEDIERTGTLEQSDLGRKFQIVNGTYQFLSPPSAVITFKTHLVVTDEDVDNIMVTALEGGINYWCRKAWTDEKYEGFLSHQLSKRKQINLVDAEEPEEYPLTYDKLIKGIKQFITKHPERGITDGPRLDCAHIDAEIADMIVQYAIFDELTFA